MYYSVARGRTVASQPYRYTHLHIVNSICPATLNWAVSREKWSIKLKGLAAGRNIGTIPWFNVDMDGDVYDNPAK